MWLKQNRSFCSLCQFFIEWLNQKNKFWWILHFLVTSQTFVIERWVIIASDRNDHLASTPEKNLSASSTTMASYVAHVRHREKAQVLRCLWEVLSFHWKTSETQSQSNFCCFLSIKRCLEQNCFPESTGGSCLIRTNITKQKFFVVGKFRIKHAV